MRLWLGSLWLARSRAVVHDAAMDSTELAIRLDQLRLDHGDLDAAIAALAAHGAQDQLAAARLKKRKLQLKDDIARIEALLIPDIIA